MYEKLIRVAEFNAECADILEKLHDPVFTLIQRNGRTPWFNEKTEKYHFIDVNGKEKTTGYWDIFFKLSMVFDKLKNKNKYTSALELMVCLLGFFYNTTNFYEVSEEINVFAKTAILTLVNKDLENDEVEIAFNIETSYELECVNNILNLLSTDIMNMSEVS